MQIKFFYYIFYKQSHNKRSNDTISRLPISGHLQSVQKLEFKRVVYRKSQNLQNGLDPIPDLMFKKNFKILKSFL